MCRKGLQIRIARYPQGPGVIATEMELLCAGSWTWPWASAAPDVLEKGVVEEAVFRENLQKLNEVSAPTF